MARSTPTPTPAEPTALEQAQALSLSKLVQQPAVDTEEQARLATTSLSQPYADPYIDPGVQDNYRAERLARGWSWAELAERFDRMPDARLASWARASGRHEAAQQRAAAGATPAPAGRQAPAQVRA